MMWALFCSVVFDDLYYVVTDQARPRGYVHEPAWWVHVRIHGLCVKEYHTSNPTRNRKAPKPCKVYKKLGLAHMLHVFAFLTPIVG